MKINKEKFGGFEKPLTFATRFEKSESSSKGFLQKDSQQNRFFYSVIQQKKLKINKEKFGE